MNARRRLFHRVAGLCLALPLVVWVATGLLFHVKHRYAEAYEALAAPLAAGPLWSRAVFSPAALQARGLLDAEAPVALAAHPRGLVAYFGRRGEAGVAVDAASGDPIPVAAEETARVWLREALRASKHAARYGDVVGVEETSVPSALTGVQNPAFTFRTTGGKRVTVDRVTGAMTQTGDLNSWIDLTYRLHYLQWTPWKKANVALVLVASPLVLLLAASGLLLAVRG